jgi:two-component system, NarL family, nitrate/nitrite sensor histidine kinase NarX
MPTLARDLVSTTPAHMLGALAAGLSNADDLEALLHDFLRPAMQLVKAQAGAVRVLNEQGRMQLLGQLGLPERLLESERLVEAGCGVCGAATAAAQPMWSGGLTPCAKHIGGLKEDGLKFSQVLAVPLQHRGRVLGVYSLFVDGDQRPDDSVLDLLRSAGKLLGMALENARLEREHDLAVAQEERRNLAAEVHDSLAQSLAYIRMRLPLLKDAMQSHDDQRGQEYWEDIRQSVGQAHTGLRQLLSDFRATPDPSGFLHAVEELTQDFKLRTGIDFHLVSCSWDEPPLSGAQQAQAFQIVQEALANTVKHARAQNVWLRTLVDEELMQIVVDDDGLGMAGNAPIMASAQHFGLDIMKSRAQRLGGTLTIEPRTSGGTRVRLTFPLHSIIRSP